MEGNHSYNPDYTLGNSSRNDTDSIDAEDYIFDKLYIRFIFITLYSVVFCMCFFGNLLVILVVTLSRRLRSITNFFLANLAVADFCVGIFCVYQNLLLYLISDWILGDFLCQMYHFIASLSYTASIFILVVICTERYFAIIYPITCKQILTPRRLRLVIVGVWITSGLYSSPKFFWVKTHRNEINGKTEIFCAPDRKKYNSEIFDIINFVLLYVIPLGIMTLLYTRIAVGLWRSSRQLEKQLNASLNTNQGIYRRPTTRIKNPQEVNKIINNDALLLQNTNQQHTNTNSNPSSSQNVLKARRGVIRMLIIVVLTFALCNLPLHARKMWQYWSFSYKGDGTFSTLLTPITFLLTYFNSGVNPLLYAFLSRNFRSLSFGDDMKKLFMQDLALTKSLSMSRETLLTRGIREVLSCAIVKNRREKHSRNINTTGIQLGGIQRNPSTRSTMKNNFTLVTIVNNEHSSECSHEL